MVITPGTNLDRYEIIPLMGAGGIGDGPVLQGINDETREGHNNWGGLLNHLHN
jgi:hypothetical protein